jgi:hypothetical protein
MNLHYHQVFTGLWICVMAAESCLLAILLSRKAYRDYPAFTAFVSFCVGRSLILFYVSNAYPSLYQPVKWIAYMPQLAILIAVVLEVLHRLFHPFDTLPGKTMVHFIRATGAVAIAAIIFAIFHPGAQPTAWMTFARAMDEVVSWILCSIFVLVALFASYFGIPWRHRLYGIGLGFLLYLAADVTVTTAVTQLRLAPWNPVWLLDMAAFLTACLIWINYFRTAEVPRSVPTCEQIQQIRAILGNFANVMDGRNTYAPQDRQR